MVRPTTDSDGISINDRYLTFDIVCSIVSTERKLSMSEAHIRLDFGNRVFEASGSRANVDAYLDRFADLVELFKSQPSVAPAASARVSATSQLAMSVMPEEFGEYIHALSETI